MSNDYNRISRVIFFQVMNIRLFIFIAKIVFVQFLDEVFVFVILRWIGQLLQYEIVFFYQQFYVVEVSYFNVVFKFYFRGIDIYRFRNFNIFSFSFIERNYFYEVGEYSVLVFLFFTVEEFFFFVIVVIGWVGFFRGLLIVSR